jgi:hypothetical protein
MEQSVQQFHTQEQDKKEPGTGYLIPEADTKQKSSIGGTHWSFSIKKRRKGREEKGRHSTE